MIERGMSSLSLEQVYTRREGLPFSPAQDKSRSTRR